LTAVLLGFEVYVGKETGASDAAIASVKCLINGAGPTSVLGQILYTDSWYTSIDLAKMIFKKYCWLFRGLLFQRKKQMSRQGCSISKTLKRSITNCSLRMV
jgi:hypothetical protein